MQNNEIKVRLTADDFLKLNKDGGLTIKSDDKFVTILSIDTKDGTLDMCSFKDTNNGLKPVTVVTKFDLENGQHFFNTIRFGSDTFDNPDIQNVYTGALSNAKELKIFKNSEKENVPIDIGDLSEEFTDIIMNAIEIARKKEDDEILLEIDGEIYRLDGELFDPENDNVKEEFDRDNKQEDPEDPEDDIDKELEETDEENNDYFDYDSSPDY